MSKEQYRVMSSIWCRNRWRGHVAIVSRYQHARQRDGRCDSKRAIASMLSFFFFKQKTAYEIGLGIPAEPLFRSHLEVKPLMTLTTVLYLSCALISGHLAMMLMELTKRR